MKMDVYELVTEDLELGIWEREFRGTLEIPNEFCPGEGKSVPRKKRIEGQWYEADVAYAATQLGLNPSKTRTFPVDRDYKVQLRGRYIEAAVQRKLREENREKSDAELETEYD